MLNQVEFIFDYNILDHVEWFCKARCMYLFTARYSYST